MTEDELRTIVDVSHEDGVIESEEKEMIYNVFDLGDVKAKEVMVPRVHVAFADVNSSYRELIEIFKEYKFTRLPVYEDTTDNVIGTINMKDLLLFEDKANFQVRNILRKLTSPMNIRIFLSFWLKCAMPSSILPCTGRVWRDCGYHYSGRCSGGDCR